jgi:hypothetical protein
VEVEIVVHQFRRSQRNRAASTIATSVVSLVTSASNAVHSPPNSSAMATVSSAEVRLLSTASTLAPFLSAVSQATDGLWVAF